MARTAKDIDVHSWLGHLYHLQVNIRHYRDCDVCALGQTERTEYSDSVKRDVNWHIAARKTGKRAVEF
jgi:hypothetical protein